MADEYAYLEPGFDPSSLTVPRLRNVLITHNVTYPSSAKKPDLIALFNEHVAPQARKIKDVQSKTKRSTRGIVDVSSSNASTLDDEEPEEPPATAPRTSRRTTRSRIPEDMVEATPSRRTTRTPGTVKRSSSKHARLVEEDDQIEEQHDPKRLASSRKSRLPVSPAPPIKQEPDEPVYRRGADSPFSADNPFQSGSSPPSAARSKSGDRRRTTLGPVVDKDRRKSRDLRRRTDGYAATKQDDGIVVPSSQTFEMPVARLRQPAKEEEVQEEDFDAGEEFTPEEQMEIVRSRAQNGERDILPPRRKRQAKKSGVTKAAPWTVLVAMLGGIATVWRQEKLQVGYCGVGQPSPSFAGVEIPEWASFLQPQCEPCPQHAYCYPELKTVCENDFVLTPHPLSLGGVIPLAPTCEPDSEKVRKIKAVADYAVDTQLRERNAKYECGEVKIPEISEQELKKVVSAKRSRRMTDEEFDELWEPALNEMIGRDEVVSRVDGASNRLLRSTSLARVSLTCAIRRSLRLTLRQHLPKLIGLLFIIASALYARNTVTTRRLTSTRAKQLAGMALNKLATQASLHAADPVAWPDSYINMAALRDDVLRDEFSAKERVRVWDVVRGLVEGNANVRPMVREGRTGEVARVWEWIGALQRIEGATPGSARRESGRFSLGGPGRIAGGDGKLIEAANGADEGNSSMQKWEEGRSYY